MVEPIMWMQDDIHILSLGFPCKKEIKHVDVNVAGDTSVMSVAARVPHMCDSECEGHLIHQVALEFDIKKIGERVNVTIHFAQ